MCLGIRKHAVWASEDEKNMGQRADWAKTSQQYFWYWLHLRPFAHLTFSTLWWVPCNWTFTKAEQHVRIEFLAPPLKLYFSILTLAPQKGRVPTKPISLNTHDPEQHHILGNIRNPSPSKNSATIFAWRYSFRSSRSHQIQEGR
jgi:hypothetical protein